MHDWIQRHPSQKSGSLITQAAGRPRVRCLVHRQGKKQNDELNEYPREIDVGQGRTGYVWLAKNARTASATFPPTAAASSSRVARRTPARLPNLVNSVRRRRGPTPGTSSSAEWRSRIDRALR